MALANAEEPAFQGEGGTVGRNVAVTTLRSVSHGLRGVNQRPGHTTEVGLLVRDEDSTGLREEQPEVSVDAEGERGENGKRCELHFWRGKREWKGEDLTVYDDEVQGRKTGKTRNLWIFEFGAKRTKCIHLGWHFGRKFSGNADLRQRPEP